MTSSEESMTWVNVMARVSLNAVTHPLEYAKILMQLGHEPLMPYRSRSIFGNEKMFYPSVFQYIKYIKKVDGLSGCYRGFSAKITGNIVSGLTFQSVMDHNKIEKCDVDESKNQEMTVQERTTKFVKNTVRESQGRAVAIILSQPFHVIAIRSMAEFVGHEGKHTGLFASIRVVYQEEGVKGFFSGVVPRIIYDLGCLWLGSVVIHVINNYFVEEKDVKAYIRASVKFLANSLMYPMQVVSNCMAVSNSGLSAATPPRMPHYTGWIDCYKHLRTTDSLRRGSSLFWRVAHGHQFWTTITTLQPRRLG